MRVISGKARGTKLNSIESLSTRPTLDRVKESLFNIIQNDIKDANVLDLFAGSGNLGIEAISNGASICYFVDNNKKCIKTIQDNIKQFGIEDNSIVIQNDYRKVLEYFRNNNIMFDIIFVDPPYQYKLMNEILDIVKEYNILKDDGIIVLEYSFDKLEENILGYHLLKYKKYGDTYVSIYQNVKKYKTNN